MGAPPIHSCELQRVLRHTLHLRAIKAPASWHNFSAEHDDTRSIFFKALPENITVDRASVPSRGRVILKANQEFAAAGSFKAKNSKVTLVQSPATKVIACAVLVACVSYLSYSTLPT